MVRHLDTSPGWIKRELRRIERKVDHNAAAKRLQASSFPNATIPMSALVNPTTPGFVNLTATNFALATTPTDLIDSTVTVPDGFTSCVVSIIGRVYAINSTATPGFLSAQVSVNGVTGNALPFRAANADSTVNVATFATYLTDLPPLSTFTVRLVAWTDAAWATNAAHTADLTGSMVWFI